MQTEQSKALGHNIRSCFAEGHAVHVDLDNLAGGAVLLYAVAGVVELGECDAERVKVLAKRVKAQVVREANDGFGEAQQQFGELHFLFVTQRDSLLVGLLLDLLVRHIGRSADAADARVRVQQVNGRVALVVQHLFKEKS